jgi:hypothetical protein
VAIAPEVPGAGDAGHTGAEDQDSHGTGNYARPGAPCRLQWRDIKGEQQ